MTSLVTANADPGCAGWRPGSQVCEARRARPPSGRTEPRHRPPPPPDAHSATRRRCSHAMPRPAVDVDLAVIHVDLVRVPRRRCKNRPLAHACDDDQLFVGIDFGQMRRVPTVAKDIVANARRRRQGGVDLDESFIVGPVRKRCGRSGLRPRRRSPLCVRWRVPRAMSSSRALWCCPYRPSRRRLASSMIPYCLATLRAAEMTADRINRALTVAPDTPSTDDRFALVEPSMRNPASCSKNPSRRPTGIALGLMIGS